jgi:hypothetical protein
MVSVDLLHGLTYLAVVAGKGLSRSLSLLCHMAFYLLHQIATSLFWPPYFGVWWEMVTRVNQSCMQILFSQLSHPPLLSYTSTVYEGPQIMFYFEINRCFVVMQI